MEKWQVAQPRRSALYHARLAREYRSALARGISDDTTQVIYEGTAEIEELRAKVARVQYLKNRKIWHNGEENKK